MPSGLYPMPNPAFGFVYRRQHDAGHRGRQRKRQIDQGIDQFLAGKGIAHQSPGDHKTAYGSHGSRQQCGAETNPKRRQHPLVGQNVPELIQAELQGFQQ